MAALIAELISGIDAFEIVRDKLALILFEEQAAQQALATAASEDPLQWALRVYTERSNAWEDFRDGTPPHTPIVNVSFESETPKRSSSNVVERQHVTGIFNIDCYGCAPAQDDPAGGHVPGDEAAALEAHRALRLVRRILMAGHYAYLGFPRGANQLVTQRWPESLTIFQPAFDGGTVEQVVGARLELAVDYYQVSPQVIGEALAFISINVKRKETGQLYFTAQYGEQDS